MSGESNMLEIFEECGKLYGLTAKEVWEIMKWYWAEKKHSWIV